MVRSRVLRTEAIVIRHSDFGEADRILTLYAPFSGKLRAVAKGVRRPTSKLGGHVELFTHSALLLAKGRNLDIVTQGETLHSFIGLRDDLERTGCACYVAELLDRLTADHIENQPAYTLLLDTLHRLSRGRSPRMTVHLFEIQLLSHLGYRPELHRCVQCRDLLGPMANFFSAAAGGALCCDCGRGHGAARSMTTNAFKVLRLLLAGDGATASQLRVDDQLHNELDAIMRSYVTFVLEGELKSVPVLRSLMAQR